MARQGGDFADFFLMTGMNRAPIDGGYGQMGLRFSYESRFFDFGKTPYAGRCWM